MGKSVLKMGITLGKSWGYLGQKTTKKYNKYNYVFKLVGKNVENEYILHKVYTWFYTRFFDKNSLLEVSFT